jgi:hypothetical protein
MTNFNNSLLAVATQLATEDNLFSFASSKATESLDSGADVVKATYKAFLRFEEVLDENGNLVKVARKASVPFYGEVSPYLTKTGEFSLRRSREGDGVRVSNLNIHKTLVVLYDTYKTYSGRMGKILAPNPYAFPKVESVGDGHDIMAIMSVGRFAQPSLKIIRPTANPKPENGDGGVEGDIEFEDGHILKALSTTQEADTQAAAARGKKAFYTAEEVAALLNANKG